MTPEQLRLALQRLMEVDLDQLHSRVDLNSKRVLEEAHNVAFKALDRLNSGSFDLQTVTNAYIFAATTFAVEREEYDDFLELRRKIEEF